MQYATNAKCQLVRIDGRGREIYTVRSGWVAFEGSMPAADWWPVSEAEAAQIWLALNTAVLGPTGAR